MSAFARCTRLAAAGLLLASLASPAQAQVTEGSSQWLAFVGCWEPVGSEGEAGLLCFRPSGSGVEMSNLLEGEVTATETLVADGVARSVNAEGCSGTESVEFSRDGHRVFTASDFICGGGEARPGSGVMSFISATQWIDVRSLTVEGEPVVWVQRYAAATAESLEEHAAEDPAAFDRIGVRARRIVATRDIVVSDVEEAVQTIDPEAVKVWVATQDTEFDLDGGELLRLVDAGVPEDLIDVMVAVSFPGRFALTPEGVPQDVVDRVADNAYRSGARVGFRSFLWDPFYSRYGYRSYGYSPFGYYGYGGGLGGGLGGGYGGYYGYVPASIVVVPRDVTNGSSGGRMINGQGYRGPSSSGGNASSGSARSAPPPRRASRDGGSSSSGSSAGSSGGGDSPSSGSSTPTRTARPR